MARILPMKFLANDDEKAAIVAAAAQQGVTISEFMRVVVLAAAKAIPARWEGKL